MAKRSKTTLKKLTKPQLAVELVKLNPTRWAGKASLASLDEDDLITFIMEEEAALSATTVTTPPPPKPKATTATTAPDPTSLICPNCKKYWAKDMDDLRDHFNTKCPVTTGSSTSTTSSTSTSTTTPGSTTATGGTAAPAPKPIDLKKIEKAELSMAVAFIEAHDRKANKPVELYDDVVPKDHLISATESSDGSITPVVSLGKDLSTVPPTPPEPTAIPGVIAGSIPSMVRSQLMMSGYTVTDVHEPSPYVKKGRVVGAVETAPKKATIVISSGKPDGGGGDSLLRKIIGRPSDFKKALES